MFQSMFERYTEKARRCIFFARYEASQFGSPEVRAEELLLGILREDKHLAHRLFGKPADIEAIREQIRKNTPEATKISVSIDLPLSMESKRALARGAEEASALNQKHIGTAHLLLGLLREEQSGAARILKQYGVTIEQVRAEAAQSEPGVVGGQRTFAQVGPPGFAMGGGMGGRPSLENSARDLTLAAKNGELPPLIGRERELDRLIQVLLRRNRNSAMLIGEPGVGKSAIVEGLAQRIAAGTVPSPLSERRVLALDASSLMFPRRPMEGPAAILFIDGLFDRGGAWSMSASGGWQCILSTTPEGWQQTLSRFPALEHQFEVISVPPPTDDEAIRIVRALKAEYEKHHSVTILDEAVNAAINAAARLTESRNLLDRALDAIDDACARVRMLKHDRTVTAGDVLESGNAKGTEHPS